MSLSEHKPLGKVDFANDLILDIHIHEIELKKLLTSVSNQYYVRFHQEKGLSLDFPFFGFKHLALKNKADFDSRDYDENKLRVKYSKVKILMAGNPSLMPTKFRLFESNFQQFANMWVDFQEKQEGGSANPEKEKVQFEKVKPDKKKKENRNRLSIKEVDMDKKTEHLGTSSKFLRNLTYMKKINQSRNSFKKAGTRPRFLLVKFRQFQVALQSLHVHKNHPLPETFFGIAFDNELLEGLRHFEAVSSGGVQSRRLSDGQA